MTDKPEVVYKCCLYGSPVFGRKKSINFDVYVFLIADVFELLDELPEYFPIFSICI